MRIAINGFGRIGKNFLRAICNDPKARTLLDVAVINVGPVSIESTGHFFKYDTLLGTYKGSVVMEGNFLSIDGKKIEIVAQPIPSDGLWKKHTIEWVVDCSGKFTHRAKAEIHLQQGAKRVLVSAPAQGEDVSLILGVNENAFDAKKHTIVSLGSCTTNALFPLLKVLHDAGGFSHGLATTIHAYTVSQALLDENGGGAERSRAAALNIVPTKSGASSMIAKVMPALEGKIDIVSVRVPVAKVSLIELVFSSPQEITVEKIHTLFEQACKAAMKNIVALSYESLVSTDFYARPESVIIDIAMTRVIGNMGHIFGWYDNEWGYSERLKDFLLCCV